MIDVLAKVRSHLSEHFARAGIIADPDEASVTFLGTERIDVLRFGPDDDGVSNYVSLGCSRHPMFDPTEMVTDALHGPRAEVVVALRGPSPTGLARSTSACSDHANGGSSLASHETHNPCPTATGTPQRPQKGGMIRSIPS